MTVKIKGVHEKGEYTFYLRPMLSDKKQFAGAAIIQAFEAGTSTGLESIIGKEQVTIYDMMGNKIGTILDGDIHSLDIPLKGMYIIVGNNSSKIFIP